MSASKYKRSGSQTATSKKNGGSVWKITSTPYDNIHSQKGYDRTKNNINMSPMFTETKDKYYDQLYGGSYCKTMTLTGFDKNNTSLTLPKTVLPKLIDWNSKVQYEVAGKPLQQPKDWAKMPVESEEKCNDYDRKGEDDNEYSKNGEIDSVCNPSAANVHSIKMMKRLPTFHDHQFIEEEMIQEEHNEYDTLHGLQKAFADSTLNHDMIVSRLPINSKYAVDETTIISLETLHDLDKRLRTAVDCNAMIC